jgi:hypothetical protein
MLGELNWWEYDFYLGLAGLVWVVVFAARYALVRESGTERPGAGLAAALTVMAVLSLGDLYAPLNALPLPFLSAERVASRFLVLPLVFLIVFAAASTQGWLEAGRRLGRQALIAAVAVAVGASLVAHARLWRVEHLEQILPARTGNLGIDVADVPANPGPRDRAYVATVRASAAVSLAAAGLFVLRWRRRPATT